MVNGDTFCADAYLLNCHRVIVLTIGWIIFLSLYMPVHFLLKGHDKLRKKIEVWLSVYLCYISLCIHVLFNKYLPISCNSVIVLKTCQRCPRGKNVQCFKICSLKCKLCDEFQFSFNNNAYIA